MNQGKKLLTGTGLKVHCTPDNQSKIEKKLFDLGFSYAGSTEPNDDQVFGFALGNDGDMAVFLDDNIFRVYPKKEVSIEQVSSYLIN